MKSIDMADRLGALADRVTLAQLACDGLEESEDANTIVAQEAYKLFLALRNVSDEVSPVKEDVAS